MGFWASSAMSLAGAFVWECCGETHPMSFNDMISTGIGGIARGEVLYRVSSLILDNTKTGRGRIGREARAFLANPIRGFNRMVSGDASEVKGNPVDPYDWRPDFQLALRAGGRVIGEGESISENTNKYGFFELALNYGNAWDSEQHGGPTTASTSISQSNFGDKTRVGRLLIRGDLFTKPLGDGKNHLLTLQQDFDYIDNEAYEYGGQGLGPGAALALRLSDSKLTLIHAAQAFFIMLGAVNSNYSFLADVANQERIREYDYGPGAGGLGRGLPAAQEHAALDRALPLQLHRRVERLDLQRRRNFGLGANHNVSQAQVKLEIPLFGGLAVGADGSLFFRRSHYDVAESTLPRTQPGRYTVTQRNPEARVFVAWTYNH